MKRVLSLVALLGLVALLFVGGRWLLNSDPGAASAASPSEERWTATESAAVFELNALADSADAGDVQLDALAGRRESDVRTSDGAAKPARAERSVTVLDASTRLPVSRVEVRYEALGANEDFRKHAVWSASTLTSWLATNAAATESDDGGLARLDTPLGTGCVVIAHTDGFIGRAHFAADEEGVKPLELVANAHIDVLALGPDGRPLAGVPIALRNRIQSHVTDSRVQTTNSGGRARFEHAGLDAAFEKRDLTWSVAIVGLLDERAEFALDPRAWPRETVQLHAGLSGVVELSILDLHGAPLASGRATLSVAKGDDDERPSFWASREEIPSEVANGRVHFPHIRLGASLVARVTLPGAPAPIKRRFDGPRAAGEVVRVELRAGVDEPVLRARLLDDKGPLASKSINWSLEHSSGWSLSRSSGHVSSDTDGVVLVPLPERWESGTKRTLRFHEEKDGPLRRARVDLSRELAPGVHDFGDLRLEPLPALASGRVVDANGRPIAQARVKASVAQTDEPSRVAGYNDLHAESDAKGEFEVRGDLEATRLTLTATTETARAPKVECAVGAREVLLTLLEGGRIAGALLLDHGVPTNSLYVSILRQDVEPSSDDRDGQARVSRDGRFEALQLDPGSYRLRVQVANTEELLAELEGLYVPADDACSDPRLAAIDLRGRLTAIRIEMTPPLPHERVVGQVFATPLDNPDAPLSVMFHDRSVALCVVGRGADLVIAAAGYKTVDIRAASGELKVKLERGPKVRLRLAPGVEVPAPPRHLKACLNRPGGQTTMLGHFQESVFDSEGELVVYASGAGEFHVEWMLEERTPNSISTQKLQTPEAQLIEVLDVPGEQVFVVHAPKAALAEALENR